MRAASPPVAMMWTFDSDFAFAFEAVSPGFGVPFSFPSSSPGGPGS